MSKTLEQQLQTLSPQEKQVLAEWLWRSAEAESEITPEQARLLDDRATAALKDPTKRFRLGDAEKKLRR